ncbi:MAG: hypothetical protein IIB58_09420 [Planctomycetes bacterium]|nr:hypothetical protein [Planctomycetota bacterium]
MDSPRVHVTLVDAIGGVVVLAALCVAACFGPLKAHSAADQLDQLMDQQSEMQTEYSRLQKIIEQNVAEWRTLKDQARREGKLDDQLPVQDRLRAVRELAERQGFNDIQIMPVQWRSAVDVAEQTFSLTATVGYIELMSFFKAFERSATWADISHLSIKPIAVTPAGTGAGHGQQYDLEITVNFYSSYEQDDEP